MRFLSYGDTFERIMKNLLRSFFRRCARLVTHGNTAALTCGVLTDSDTAVALCAVIEIIGICRLIFLHRSDRYVMNCAFIYFVIHRFQLCHVHCVSVFTACGDSCNLTGESCFVIPYGNGPSP